jgi:hypothetical protein
LRILIQQLSFDSEIFDIYKLNIIKLLSLSYSCLAKSTTRPRTWNITYPDAHVKAKRPKNKVPKMKKISSLWQQKSSLLFPLLCIVVFILTFDMVPSFA